MIERFERNWKDGRVIRRIFWELQKPVIGKVGTLDNQTCKVLPLIVGATCTKPKIGNNMLEFLYFSCTELCCTTGLLIEVPWVISNPYGTYQRRSLVILDLHELV